MGFIDPSAANGITVAGGAYSTAQSQGNAFQVMPDLSGDTSSAILSVTNGASDPNSTQALLNGTGGLSGSSTGAEVTAIGNSKPASLFSGFGSPGISSGSTTALGTAASTIKSASSAITGVVNQVTGVEKAVNAQLQSALTSITGTFTGAVNSLASGINPSLSGLFKNTNVKTAATTTTAISDPVATNLLKAPNASAFTIGSFQAGSQTVGSSGISVQFGTGAGTMVGTSLSTVLDRYQLDSSANLGGTITSSTASAKTGGLFSSLGSIVKSVSTVVKTVKQVESLAVNTVHAVESTAVRAATVAINSVTGAINSVERGVANDLGSFVGRTSGLTGLTGQPSSAYFMSGSPYTLATSNGTLVNTNGSGIDANTANTISNLAGIAGCVTGGVSYTSYNELASLYNAALNLATKFSLTDLVNSLLGCNQASTVFGQQSLVSSFMTATTSSVTLATSIAGKIQSPATLNTPYVNQSIVMNPNLSAKDLSSVSVLTGAIGSTPTTGYVVPGTEFDQYPLYDPTVIAQANPSFTTAVTGDSTLNDYMVGFPITLDGSGQMGWMT